MPNGDGNGTGNGGGRDGRDDVGGRVEIGAGGEPLVSQAAPFSGDPGGEYRTFMGAGFGTLMVQLAAGPKDTPGPKPLSAAEATAPVAAPAPAEAPVVAQAAAPVAAPAPVTVAARPLSYTPINPAMTPPV